MSGCIPITSRYQQSVLGAYTDHTQFQSHTQSHVHDTDPLNPTLNPASDPGLTHPYDMGPELGWDDAFTSGYGYTELEFYQQILFNDRVLYAFGLLTERDLMEKSEQSEKSKEKGESDHSNQPDQSDQSEQFHLLLDSYRATKAVFEKLLRIPSFMSITQDCITHYNSINSNINSNSNSDNNSNNNNPNQQSIPPVAMEISRYDRWLYLHYLPSVLVPHVNTIYENNNGNTNGNTNKNSKNTNKNSNENTNENSENIIIIS